MKRFFLALLLICNFATITNAQSSIGAFYGVELGQTKTQVESILNQKGVTYQWTYEDGASIIKVSSPYLGEVSFQGAALYFKNNSMYKGVFFSSDGGYFFTDHPLWSTNKASFDNRAKKWERDYYTVKMNLCSKYGPANVDSDTKATWRRGNRQISVEFDYDVKPESPTSVFLWSRIGVTYEIVDVSDF